MPLRGCWCPVILGADILCAGVRQLDQPPKLSRTRSGSRRVNVGLIGDGVTVTKYDQPASINGRIGGVYIIRVQADGFRLLRL